MMKILHFANLCHVRGHFALVLERAKRPIGTPPLGGESPYENSTRGLGATRPSLVYCMHETFAHTCERNTLYTAHLTLTDRSDLNRSLPVPRRHTPAYGYSQPDYRLHELNKRLSQRTEVSTLSNLPLLSFYLRVVFARSANLTLLSALRCDRSPRLFCAMNSSLDMCFVLSFWNESVLIE